MSGYTGGSMLRHERRSHPVALHMLQASFLARAALAVTQERTLGKTSLNEGEKYDQETQTFQEPGSI